MTASWFCEAHQRTVLTDCPKCDDEQIADLERYANLPTCQSCKRTLAEGEQAWASDWKVIDTSGTTVTFRMETRYTCDDCEAKP